MVRKNWVKQGDPLNQGARDVRQPREKKRLGTLLNQVEEFTKDEV